MKFKHARKSPFFNDGKPWIKKDSNSLLDVTIGSYDGAEIFELVGLFILNNLKGNSGKENIGPCIYKDDALAIMKNKSARLADKTQTFLETTPIYQNALRHSNFDHKLDYTKQRPENPRRNRQRNIIWFNPSFSIKNVKTITSHAIFYMPDRQAFST